MLIYRRVRSAAINRPLRRVNQGKAEMENNFWFLLGGFFGASALVCLTVISVKNWGKSPLKTLTVFEIKLAVFSGVLFLFCIILFTIGMVVS